MSDELWNAKLTRENISDFYYSTVVMVYSSVYEITGEATRCENAIVKSYLDIYGKRNIVPDDRVIFEFGDILLENANRIVEEYPLPADMVYSERVLDEYTRNSMLEKILSKIDSKGYKMAEFVSSDMKVKKGRSRKKGDVFAVTPLLVCETLFLAAVIWLIAYASITMLMNNDTLIDEKSMYESSSVQEQFVSAMMYFPLSVDVTKSTKGTIPQGVLTTEGDDTTESAETESAEAALAPSLATETSAEVSATSG